MTLEFLSVMKLPFLACLILTGIHAYLGFHVIARQVVFVDLALAQMAVLGTTIGVFCGFSWESFETYIISLAFTVVGALIFSLTRLKRQVIPQEAIIGLIYAVSSAMVIILLSKSGQGDEYLKQSLSGQILLVSPYQVMKLLILYLLIGIFHYIFRRHFLLISENYLLATDKGLNVRGWDFLFYLSFGLVVTSSVQIAGILLVFTYLIAPAVCALLLENHWKERILLGWVIGFIGSIVGIFFSYYFDVPTAPIVIVVFGIIFLILSLWRNLRAS